MKYISIQLFCITVLLCLILMRLGSILDVLREIV